MINIMFEGGLELNIDYNYDQLEKWIRENNADYKTLILSGHIIKVDKILWIKKIGN